MNKIIIIAFLGLLSCKSYKYGKYYDKYGQSIELNSNGTYKYKLDYSLIHEHSTGTYKFFKKYSVILNSTVKLDSLPLTSSYNPKIGMDTILFEDFSSLNFNDFDRFLLINNNTKIFFDCPTCSTKYLIKDSLSSLKIIYYPDKMSPFTLSDTLQSEIYNVNINLKNNYIYCKFDYNLIGNIEFKNDTFSLKGFKYGTATPTTSPQ